jgi:hypothetical protein
MRREGVYASELANARVEVDEMDGMSDRCRGEERKDVRERIRGRRVVAEAEKMDVGGRIHSLWQRGERGYEPVDIRCCGEEREGVRERARRRLGRGRN